MTLNISAHARGETTALPEVQFYVYVMKGDNHTCCRNCFGLHHQDECMITVIFTSTISLKGYLHSSNLCTDIFKNSLSCIGVTMNEPNIWFTRSNKKTSVIWKRLTIPLVGTEQVQSISSTAVQWRKHWGGWRLGLRPQSMMGKKMRMGMEMVSEEHLVFWQNPRKSV